MTSPSISRNRDESGLGLVSLMLVILALSMAAITVMAVIAPSLATRQRLATEEKGRALRGSVDRFHAHRGTWPTDLSELFTPDPGNPCAVDMTSSPPVLQGWCGPYLEPLIANGPLDFGDDYRRDGWGTLYSYDSGTGGLSSCGPDRSCGGGDDIAFE